MKKTIKQALLVTSLMASALTISPTILAETAAAPEAAPAVKADAKQNTAGSQNAANKAAIANQAKTQNKLLETVNKEVSEGFKKVMQAGKLIQDGKEKEAIKALGEATGKFDIALAANPEMSLIPIDAHVRVTEMITSSDAVKAQVSLAKDLLKQSKVQAARAILLPMRDDIETRTAYIPMATYPDAIKLATKMLVDGDKTAATQTLSAAFSTIVQKVSIIPLSLVRAESLITSASTLDKEKGKDQAMALLDQAEEQLQIAVNLGYTDKNSDLYDDLSAQIKALKKEAAGPNMVEKLYDKLKTSVKSLIKKNSEQVSEKKADDKK